VRGQVFQAVKGHGLFASIMAGVWFGWMCVAVGISPAAAAEPAAKASAVPTAVFAAHPALTGLSLSPDGQRMLGILQRDGKSVLVTAKWDGSEMRGIMESDNQKFLFNWAHWVNNKRLVASLRFPSYTRGVKLFETRALAMDVDGENIVNLVPPPREHKSEKLAQDQDTVIDWLPDDGQHVLMTILDDFEVYAPGVYNVDVNTGKRTLVLGPRRDVWEWRTDRQHRVRLGIRRWQDKDLVEVIGRDPEGSDWRPLWSFSSFSRDDVWPLAFGKDPQTLYVRALKGERRALYLAHLDKLNAEGHPSMELVAADEHEDMDLGRFLPDGELIGVGRVHEGDAQRTFLQEPMKELARGIDQSLPHRYNYVYGFSRDLTRYVVESDGNGVPGQIFVGDRKAGTLKLVGEQYPELKSEQLVGKRRVRFKARDGLEIHGFLTVPAGDTPEVGWPMVLLPHGGPISADDIEFDTWTEFLASRGYAVMQINFRGSESLGRSFRDAGLQRWGLEMQDDLTDGVKWAVDRQIANPKRLCVVGASYGGYAALMGVVKTPDLYRCAVSFAGVSNLIDLSRHWQSFMNAKVADKQVGNYWNDRERLKQTSPSERAAEIKVPVLLVHGTNDVQVPYSQSETMAKALKAAGKPYQFITQEGGDHNLSRQSDSLQFLDEVQRFLDKNIGPESPAAK